MKILFHYHHVISYVLSVLEIRTQEGFLGILSILYWLHAIKKKLGQPSSDITLTLIIDSEAAQKIRHRSTKVGDATNEILMSNEMDIEGEIIRITRQLTGFHVHYVTHRMKIEK